MWTRLREQGLKRRRDSIGVYDVSRKSPFVMAGAGLPQLLYGEGGMKPTPEIQKLLDEGMGFAEISTEK